MKQTDQGEMLYGVAAIASFLGMPKRAAQHQIDTGRIPTFRLGANICATKIGMRKWLAEQEAKARA